MTIAFGFDFDHTLGRDHGLETIAFYRLAAAVDRPLDQTDSLWAERIAELLRRFRANSATLEEAVAEFVVALGVAGETADRQAMRYRDICYSLVDELVTPVEGARELLTALAQHGVPHAILTNGWSPLQYMKIVRALDFDGTILVSDEVGFAKPDAAAFAKLVDALGVARECCWYVGDNPKIDVAGAKKAGLHGVWYDARAATYPSDATPPDLRITALDELLALVPGHDALTEKQRH
ncbi:MAG: HAD family hydrolase [Candidatus Velthaea sp.]